MIIITHEIDFAMQVADKIIVMDQGKIIEEKNVDNITNKEIDRVLDSFIGEYDISDMLVLCEEAHKKQQKTVASIIDNNIDTIKNTTKAQHIPIN